MTTDRILGVLGGMGPLATVEFLRKLIETTPAKTDQEHIPCITYSVPQVPCRVAAILEGGPSPLPALLVGVKTLEAAGAQAIAMPCVTAHYWYEQMAASTRMPILHIVRATLAALASKARTGQSIGILATRATLQAGHFQRSLQEAGYVPEIPARTTMETCVLPAIANVKRGRHQQAHRLAVMAIEDLRALGAERVVLACTELSVALQGADDDVNQCCIDTVEALARACVQWATRDIK